MTRAIDLDLAAALDHYAQTRVAVVRYRTKSVDPDMLEALDRVQRAEKLCGVTRIGGEHSTLGGMCRTGLIVQLADRVRKVGAQRAYTWLDDTTTDSRTDKPSASSILRVAS